MHFAGQRFYSVDVMVAVGEYLTDFYLISIQALGERWEKSVVKSDYVEK